MNSGIFKVVLLCLGGLVYTPCWAYLTFEVSASKNLNNGTATTLAAYPAASSASYASGNVMVFYAPSTLKFNTACLTASGSETWRASGTNFTLNVPAATIFGSGKTNSSGITGSDSKITFVTSGGVVVSNSCSTDQDFEVARQVSIGENHWDYHLKGTAPAKITCNVSMPSTVDFGTITNNPGAGTELKSVSSAINVNCSKAVDGTKYSIITQVNGTSGLYNNTATRLKLTGAGGYITGELNNSLTGSGACTADGGLKFDSTATKLSSGIENGATLSNILTWRLCSDGQSMTLGALSASAVISVSIN